MTSTLVKIGPKGQMLIKKEYREKLGLKPGCYAETEMAGGALLIRAPDAETEMLSALRIRRAVVRRWPKGLDSVHAVREQRE